MKATAEAATTLDKPASKAPPKRGSLLKKGHPNQLDMFALEAMADDFLAAADAAEAAAKLQESTTHAVAATPALAAEVATGGRDSLDFARFMRSANMPSAEIDGALAAIGAEPAKVRRQVDKVESVLEGADADFLPGADVEVDMGEFDAEADAPDDTLMVAGDSSGADTTSLFLASLRGKRFDPLTAEQMIPLAARVKQGDMAARDELVNRNMRFMVTMARRHLKTGRPFDDLIQAGSEGLIEAAMRFDPAKGKFTTIATWWILQKIQRSVQSDSNMPVPSYLPGQEAKLRRMAAVATTPEAKAQLEAKADIAAKRLESRRRNAVSLDSSRGGGDEDDGANMLSMLEAESPGQEEQLERVQLVTKLVEVARTLPGRERDMFLMRIGLHPEHPGDSCTLAEIAAVFDVSRERVRQIYVASAGKVADMMEKWAKEEDNLPDGFRKGLMNPGKG
jgi:RNA polymerase sigma factor (sigma-70 family)